MPRVGAVSLVQYGAVGVPVVSPAPWMRVHKSWSFASACLHQA